AVLLPAVRAGRHALVAVPDLVARRRDRAGRRRPPPVPVPDTGATAAAVAAAGRVVRRAASASPRISTTHGNAGHPMGLKKGIRQLVADANARIATIAVEDAKALLGDPGVQFVDIRDVRELEREGMVPGAFHAP